MGFDRAPLTLPFFSCGVELGVLAGKAHVASCCAAGDGPFVLGFRVPAEESCTWVREQPEKSQTTQILQDRFQRLRVFPLFALKSIQGRALLSQARLVPACRRCRLRKRTPRGRKQPARSLAGSLCSRWALELAVAAGGSWFRMAGPCLLSRRGAGSRRTVTPGILSLRKRGTLPVALA